MLEHTTLRLACQRREIKKTGSHEPVFFTYWIPGRGPPCGPRPGMSRSKCSATHFASAASTIAFSWSIGTAPGTSEVLPSFATMMVPGVPVTPAAEPSA